MGLEVEQESDFFEQEEYQRDSIIILGRTQVGKTVYLSLLYDMLWSGDNEIKMRAVRGVDHKYLIENSSKIKSLIKNNKKSGWVAPTAEKREIFLEVEYKDKKRTMIAYDYPGELFSETFINERKEDLFEHIDHAKAIILLIDPEQHIKDEEARLDNDYGMVQAIKRTRNWPGGDEVPLILVFTKADRNEKNLKKYGGMRKYAQTYFKELILNAKNIKLCTISALSPNGRNSEQGVYCCTNLRTPLLYCMEMLEENERKLKDKKTYKKIKQDVLIAEQRQKKKERKVFIIFLIVLVLLIIFVISIQPKSVWINIKYNLFKWLIG